MEETTTSFEQVLSATLRMIRTTWKAAECLFLQLGDDGQLHVRAYDCMEGLNPRPAASFPTIKPINGLVAQSLKKNVVLESGDIPWDDGLGSVLNQNNPDTKKYMVVPVSGQARVLGALILGPFSPQHEAKPREEDLRSAGTLCAVLSAYWRLYEWMSFFIPQFNHELRTPLTAIQGSLGMVLGGVCGEVGTEVKEMLEMAQKGCQRTVSAIEEYLNRQIPQK